MLFVYECTENIITDFKKFYDTQLSAEDKRKIFIPTYDCMKKYQGSWHIEKKSLFRNCFFIECRDKKELKSTLSRQHCSDFLAEAVMSGIKLRAFSYIIQAIILLVTCVSMKPHVWYVGIASFVAALIMLLVQYVFTKRLTHELKVKTSDFSVKCIKDFLVNGIWNAINNIGNLLNSGLDLLITNKMLTELLMGMVSVSKTLGSLCYTLVVAISSSFRPKQLEAYSHKDKEKLIELLKNSMLITGTVCAIILAGFNACGEDFLHLWLPSQNHEILFQLAMITLMSDILIGVVNPLYYVFTLTKKLKVPCLITIIMGILNISGMYALIKYTDLGVYAVVLTTMVLNCVHFIDTPLYASYCLNIKMITFYPVIILHFLNTAVLFLWTSLINCYWPNVYSWAMLLVKVIFSGITEMIIVVVLMTTTEQKKQLLKILGKYVKRKVRGQ